MYTFIVREVPLVRVTNSSWVKQKLVHYPPIPSSLAKASQSNNSRFIGDALQTRYFLTRRTIFALAVAPEEKLFRGVGGGGEFRFEI